MQQHAPQRATENSAAATPRTPAREVTDNVLGNQARLRHRSTGVPVRHTGLRIGAADDPLEHEADAIADRIMRMPVPNRVRRLADHGTLRRACAACDEDSALRRKGDDTAKQDPQTPAAATPAAAPPAAATPAAPEEPCAECETEATAQGKLQASPTDAFVGGGEAPELVHAALQASGRPLDPAARAFFEPRFGHDFNDVRVHTGGIAAASAASVSARAYTVGQHIAFAEGEYAPHSASGRRLLAHELTHVVQQRAPNAGPRVSRDLIDDAKQAAEDIKKQLQEAALQKLRDLGNKPLGPPSGYSNPACPKEFCQPFADKTQAMVDLAWAGPLILAGIALKVNPRVLPFWASHMAGGAAPQNISANFGADFTNSPTTAGTTKFLVGALRNDVQTAGATLLGGAASATVDFTPRLTAALAQIDDQTSGNPMDFNVIGDIPGNLAGGIGKDETAFPIGAQPSPFNNSRQAKISASLTKQANGDIVVAPAIQFTVADTVDLCPGNCGATVEQAATVPLSRFEATGISGDVPFTVQFPAPAKELTPFTVTPTPKFPQTGTGQTTAKLLRVRSGPGLKFPVIKVLAAAGTPVNVTSQAHAEVVNGTDVWDKIDGGWVSHAYVAFSAAP